MKISTKIILVVLTVLLICGCAQVIVQHKINEVNTSIEKEQWWSNRAMGAMELKVDVEHQVSALGECVLFGGNEQINHFKELSQNSMHHLDEMINNTKRQETRAQLQKVKDNQKQFMDIANNEIIPAINSGDIELANQVLLNKAKPLVDQIENELGKWVKDRQDEVTEQQKVVTKAGQVASTYGLVFTILALLIGVIISLLLARNIANELKKLVNGAEIITSGDLTQKLDIKGSSETAELAQAFNKMQDELKEVLGILTTDSMTLAAHSEQLSAASEEVSANVHGMAGLTTELAATAENQAANASEASAVSREAEKVAQEGGQSVKDVVLKMESISETVNNSTKVMGKLSEQSQRIGHIIEAITGIADQTNLLALNAAIEAARAGEHGKGFAVVADEVRSLAEQSALAAKEISDIVNEIRQDIDLAVNAMGMGAQEVNEGVAVVEKAGHSLEEIVQKVADSSMYITEISAGTEQTSDASQDLAHSTDQVNSAVENIAQSTISLAKMADELNGLVKRFKLSEKEKENYWQDKDPCWEIKKCVAEGRDPKECGATKYSGYPCWNIKGTHCKGESGIDIRECKECEVYQKYGDNEPLVVYSEKLLERN